MQQLTTPTHEEQASHRPGRPQIAAIRLRIPCTGCAYITEWHSTQEAAQDEYDSNHPVACHRGRGKQR